MSTDTIAFSVAGDARIACVGNGDLTWDGPFGASALPLFRGRAVAYVRGGLQPGEVLVTAQCGGLAATVPVRFERTR